MKSRITSITLILLTLFVLLAGCSNNTPAPTPDLTPTEYCDYTTEILEVEDVGSGNTTDIELIISLAPDVVFMGTMAQTEAQNNQLEAAGIAVIVSDANDLAGTYDSIVLTGKVLNRNDEAIGIINDMRSKIANIEEKASQSSVDGKRIYFEVSPLEWGLWTTGEGTFINEAATILGLENVFNDVNGWAEVSEEQVLERKPDFIVTTTMAYEGIDAVDGIKSRTGWDAIPAVADDKIIEMSDNSLMRPGPRLAAGIEQLYNFVYGD